MTSKRRRILAAAGITGVLLASAACSSEHRATRDAPVHTDLQDNQAPFVVNFPNGFHGLTVKCLDGVLLVTHTRDAAPLAVDDASPCKPGEAEKLGIPRVGGVTPSAS